MISRKLAPLRLPAILAAALALVVASPEAGASIVLTDNTSATPSGTTDVSGAYSLASDFSTNSSSYTLNSVTLLLAQGTRADVAEVAIYTDGGQEPGSLVATLVSPTSYASVTPAAATFTPSGPVTLYANSIYWVVLKATTGDFFWSYTDSDVGSGTGFEDSYAESFNSGQSWDYQVAEPNQFSVTATANPASAAPEPGSLTLLGLGLVAAMGARLRRRARQAA